MAAVIKDTEHKVKLEIADFPLFPRLAILDPEATRTLPPCSPPLRHGRDDLRDRGLRVRRLEPPPGRLLMQALRMIRDNLERAVETPGDEDARGTC